ncbi:hypothetical protein CEXT_181771 [Caerostris extrusa]|uniref:Uncharacterized protein n=1 Tax=Caerostris extrusa TaxID=172846 RepID=A0AAV4UUM2_CAEEX|nr:hypothetical protein CEXT_181771 [Caerostris extrusa]
MIGELEGKEEDSSRSSVILGAGTLPVSAAVAQPGLTQFTANAILAAVLLVKSRCIWATEAPTVVNISMAKMLNNIMNDQPLLETGSAMCHSEIEPRNLWSASQSQLEPHPKLRYS